MTSLEKSSNSIIFKIRIHVLSTNYFQVRDHFFQCVLKNMKGVREPTWDYEDALGDGMDLSRTDIWGGESGKAQLEFEMADRLHGIQVARNIIIHTRDRNTRLKVEACIIISC
ncbi:hypothetical protein BJV74DRAFT_272047 [Russula compacta]|nr:hypothetical protein BJV74DRAFT_272047 [Russula compacta]